MNDEFYVYRQALETGKIFHSFLRSKVVGWSYPGDQPGRLVLINEYNPRMADGTTVKPLLNLHPDSSTTSPETLHWTLNTVERQHFVYSLAYTVLKKFLTLNLSSYYFDILDEKEQSLRILLRSIESDVQMAENILRELCLHIADNDIHTLSLRTFSNISTNDMIIGTYGDIIMNILKFMSYSKQYSLFNINYPMELSQSLGNFAYHHDNEVLIGPSLYLSEGDLTLYSFTPTGEKSNDFTEKLSSV